MSHFYERVINKNLSYGEEISKIKTLFFGEKHVSTRHYYQTVSASTLIDGVYFRKLPVSANYIHLSDMWSDLIKGDEPDTFIGICEFILSIERQLLFSNTNIRYNEESLCNKLAEIRSLIEIDLDKLNLKYEFIKTEIGVVATIIPKDVLLETVISDSNSDLTQLLVKYKSLRMEGNTKGKEEILMSISKHIEPLLKDEQLKTSNKRLFDNVGFLLNNLNIRHNNVEINNQEFFNKTAKNREQWLDYLFLLALLVFKSKEEFAINQGIERLKTNF